VERNSASTLPGWLSSFSGPENVTPAFRLSRVIRMAGEDERVQGIVFDLSHLDYASMAVLQEIGSDLQFFRSKGKTIYAWADHYNLYSYYIASAADKVFMDSMGSVLLPGFSLYRSYYGKGMNKWNLNMAYFHAGEFKSYGDSYLSSSMSPELKKENSRWINSLWSQYLDEVSRFRGLKPGELKNWIMKYPDQLKSFPSESQYALSSSIVDGLKSSSEYDSLVMKNLEKGEKSIISYEEYEKILKLSGFSQELRRVCVLTAAGPIQEGESNPWSIGSDTLIRQLDQVLQDHTIRALVLRLDTGGGSAYASELIRRKLQELKKHGISIVVSMGGVTASGGYWIATAGDEIWAAPGSITGSIGVFTMIPQVADFAKETLGITSDGVGTTWMSGQERLDQNLNKSSRTYYQTSVNQTYNQFLHLVSESRGLSISALMPLAEGRVWSGQEAFDSGLADHLGTLNDSIKAAAALAGLENYNIVYQNEKTLTIRNMIDKFLQGNLRLKSFIPGMNLDLPDLIPGRVYALSPLIY